MMIWVLVFAAMLLLVTAMSVGVLMGRKPIAGSCGGLNNLGLKQGCDICGGKDEICEEEQKKRAGVVPRAAASADSSLGYDATRRRT
ncbi:(Na+)-NQR maturation NqrM [Larsenimonas rhizosphaerae]|uniref:(Na+)-NQR maturation NqrM n=1 Tax=Larsenimonas rhizosphaerae TaxID=2944682 RepID=A0AA41ZF65_9GAMM|nr:(Na+)-NQR maturation NqrM [Larsenimonas rhizosphaerae]MCM2130987.1 (Na+)-NQR maturation NqrM [Larsenimonas rhizosphaerae]MCX2523692.1 (Na+)-NQR maturation NqrM [Larsenimonas rhizosphaerae]